MDDKASSASVEDGGDTSGAVQNGGCPTAEVRVVSSPTRSPSSPPRGNDTGGGGSSRGRRRVAAADAFLASRDNDEASRLSAASADQQIRSSSPLMAAETPERPPSKASAQDEEGVNVVAGQKQSQSSRNSASSPAKRNSSSRRRRQQQLSSSLLPPRSPRYSSVSDSRNEEDDPRIMAAELSQRLENASAELVDNLFRFVSACRQGDSGNSGFSGRGAGDSRNTDAGITNMNSGRGDTGHTGISSNNNSGSRRQHLRGGKARKKEKNMGLTLPASAIGWLSSRMDPQPGDDDGDYRARISRGRSRRTLSASAARASLRQSSANSMQLSERLALLRYHLPRYVENLRITNDEWPPPPPPPLYDNGSDVSAATSAVRRQGGGRLKVGIGSPIKGAKDTPSPGSGRNILSPYYMYASLAATSENNGEGSSGTLEETLAAKYSRSPQKQAAVRFLFFWHRLQHRPCVDMALFANVKVLLIDGVIPEWIVNMRLIRKSLYVLRVERACVYDLSSFLFPRDDECGDDDPTVHVAGAGEAASERNDLKSDAANEEALHSAAASYELSLSHVANLDLQRFHATDKSSDELSGHTSCDIYPNLTHLKLSYCAIGESSGVRLKSEEERISDISSDERRLIRSTCNLQQPFAHMPSLKSLNLSHNNLVRATTACAGLNDLPKLSALDLSFNRLTSMAKAYLILGNIKTLVLSWNELSSVDGLDRLYSLERLALDHNKISYLQDVAGLASLPELMQLEMRGNPIEANDSRFRVNVLNVFKERRFSLLPNRATFRQLQQILPTLDGQSATPGELLSLKEMTFAPFLVSSSSVPTVFSDGVVDDAKDGGSSTVPTASHEDVPSFSPLTIQDASTSLSIATSARRVRRCVPRREANIRASGDAAVRAGIDAVTSTDRKVAAKRPWKNSHHLSSPFSVEDVISALVSRSAAEDEIGQDDDSFVDAESSAESDSESDDYVTSDSDENEDEGSFVSASSHPIVGEALAVANETNHESSAGNHSGSEPDSNTATPKGEKTTERPNDSAPSLDSASRDEETRADGQGANKLPLTNAADFPDLLPDHASTPSDDNEGRSGGVAVLASSNSQEKRPYDFGAAEKAAIYDGSQSYNELSVPAYLHLYFQTFVFPPTLTKEGNLYGDKTDTADENGSNFPRVQLFHSDRELATRAPEDRSNGPRVPINEKFIDAWREEIMACGLASTSRLPPVKQSLRGFHGEIVRDRGFDVAFSESQSVLLCLTDAALYFIPDFSLQDVQERRFPAPLPRNAVFKDAFWPHALARHPLEYLQRITIGFQFQRLVLHFVTPRNSTQTQEFEYVYVAFTCNKLRTISLVQKLQAQKKALHFDCEELVIDNDDRVILDSLADAIAPTAMGVVLHYQVLRQKWKHQRLDGTDPEVRRVCVLTDSHIYLLDENYVGDGSTTTLIQKGRYGDAALALVDAAELSQVTEIRAADEDPKHITLVVQAKSRLMRSHRWRLVCKDGESAERLIDDVRRSVAAL